MSWLDKLAATPTVGLKLQPHFASSDAINDALVFVLNRQAKPLGVAGFEVERVEPHVLSFSTDEGFTYSVEATRFSVGFKHRVRARPASAGPPIMELMSRPLPFTQLLPKVIDLVAEAAPVLPHRKDRRIERVGIVATTTVDEEAAPPGIRKFIEYIGRPWGGLLASYGVRISAELRTSASYVDTCIHTFNKPDDPEAVSSFVFDWQRAFLQPQIIERSSLSTLLTHASKVALEYFEEIAVGSMWDERIISGSSAGHAPRGS